MTAPDDHDRALERLLSGTPERVTDSILGVSETVRADVDASIRALSSLALALPTVTPSPEAREKLRLRLQSLPDRPQRKVVLVVDMICDYLTPGRPLFIPRAREIVPQLQAFLAEERTRGTPIVYVCDEHEPNDPDLEAWPVHAVRGTDGPTVIPELSPQSGEPVVGHRTYSAFFETNLQQVLDGLGAQELIFTGCSTEIGILATAMDALMRGFHVSVPPACHAGTSAQGEEAAVGIIKNLRPLRPMPRAQ